MTLNRNLIRQFIATVEWATASNICYLLAGRSDSHGYAIVATELNRMCRTKRRDIRLKKLHHDFYTCYALAGSTRTAINRQHAEHDIRLRDCLGKYFHICGPGLMEFLTIKTFADAMLTLNTGNLYFEFDSGHMGRKQLKEKIRSHYIGKGAYRVVFWMGTAEYAHWKHTERIKTLEQNRLTMLFEVVWCVMKEKPNRILGAGYHDYLANGKFYNFRGDDR